VHGFEKFRNESLEWMRLERQTDAGETCDD
jgi:hypothetical protein